MAKNKKKEKIETLEDKLKYEIAEELGLMDKINEVGWGGLTAKESGKIGGIITVRKRKMKIKDDLKK
ncbi:small, acid-soluble spore protein, alpha/beta type [Sporanaerobacter acetigenes]|uniref:Small, acid-soluble spore protein, alpha/beta type n=1 Tax=Sporanaerobacter acetigenes DSM 13106 TaxID=1123281 RepID=A0A1M5WTY7_9FIRM|nr:small, acid-soluble spore protein, alpha/beta type [Sporanaerobacter acetigenes]SHH90900.1 Small, acid-soluble spore protein, alpha/beta type [Sporanaerobacter acetigenes DSM 13106]